MNYIEHLEKHCGEIKGSLELEDMMQENIQFLKFENAPIDNTYTATSLGLLWNSLQFEDGRIAHQEVMMSVKQPEAEEDVIELLWRLTTHALETGQAFELGEFYSMPETVFGQYRFAGVYVTAPFYFDETFFVHTGDASLKNRITSYRSGLFQFSNRRQTILSNRAWMLSTKSLMQQRMNCLT